MRLRNHCLFRHCLSMDTAAALPDDDRPQAPRKEGSDPERSVTAPEPAPTSRPTPRPDPESEEPGLATGWEPA